jgi:pyruvate formate lyase activating enzyme
VQRFSIHDGPGIRTTAFLKGCPLTCAWCQNPEGIPLKRIMWYHPERCIRCERCVQACPHGALAAHPERERFIEIDRKRCSDTCPAVDACPTGALEWDSHWYTPRELVTLFERDMSFYESSGGGITLSGGEPLHQPAFTEEVLRLSREAGLHTALETTLFASPATLDRLLPLVDLFLSDIKLADTAAHRQETGVPNERILKNMRRLAADGAPLLVRIPLIPETTTSEENLRATARLVRDLPGDVPVELINFNPLPKSKYDALGSEWKWAEWRSPFPAETMERFRTIVAEEGVTVVGEE